MTKDVQHTYDSYLDAYRDIGPAERDRLLRQSVTAEVVSVNPNGEGLGFDNLVEHIQQFQERNPGAYFKANKLLTHYEQFLSEWTMYSKDGAVVTTAPHLWPPQSARADHLPDRLLRTSQARLRLPDPFSVPSCKRAYMASTVWRGFITFGLISIPVRLFRAARAERVNLRRLRREAPPSKFEEASDEEADSPRSYTATSSTGMSQLNQPRLTLVPKVCAIQPRTSACADAG